MPRVLSNRAYTDGAESSTESVLAGSSDGRKDSARETSPPPSPFLFNPSSEPGKFLDFAADKIEVKIERGLDEVRTGGDSVRESPRPSTSFSPGVNLNYAAGLDHGVVVEKSRMEKTDKEYDRLLKHLQQAWNNNLGRKIVNERMRALDQYTPSDDMM